MFEKEKRLADPSEGLIEVHNVYEIVPPDGTIIGMATPEEMEVAAELELQHYAYSRLLEANIQLDGSSYKDILQEFQRYERKSMEFWRALHKRLAVPWAWVLRVDVANGPIYVNNGNAYYDDDEDEEDYE
ncbi:hypothetical protein CON65_09005 [Bacillus pseudomycoides]|uniref:Group-specific protein n=1 Tax=Bacillus pseudomycoides TaxID=64104 RepID=A0AA91ZU33_9BACI|nr:MULTISPECIES: hypothetical protein [Bacillus]PEB50805.1 hypothetical protein COO03_20255 [Bacillus sp. AFS098217]PED82992.1 hypothetical protein CON65_09005 [Bacillus pseudomycoides]PEU06179.1 hypothetical protein CN524_24210 [Bacillus sp. AFS019443]PEU20130.1 hypothetical protein CN525_05125 [Bacillus sp. AFS014408]PFW62497.1 hypothetical protein COL20_12605 [Bacillus sp. AFS075034]